MRRCLLCSAIALLLAIGGSSIGGLSIAASAEAAEESAAERVERFAVPISEVDLRIVPGFPLQVLTILRGHLPDSCSQLEAVEQRFVPEQRTYRLSASATRSPEVVCAQVLTPFEVRLPIVKAGLAAGEFVVSSEEISVGFEVVPLGEFPGLDLPSSEETVWICFVEPALCFAPPAEWKRRGSAPIWTGPDYLSSRLGSRFHPRPIDDPAALLPPGAEVHDSTPARLANAVGTRFAVERDAVWSEHLFAPCGAELWCELWLEAPSEPLLDAAGEAFWRLVRFAIRY